MNMLNYFTLVKNTDNSVLISGGFPLLILSFGFFLIFILTTKVKVSIRFHLS